MITCRAESVGVQSGSLWVMDAALNSDIHMGPICVTESDARWNRHWARPRSSRDFDKEPRASACLLQLPAASCPLPAPARPFPA